MKRPGKPLVEVHNFRADGLGLPAFPVGTEPGPDLGEHIMGVTVIAWLTQYPLSRWGEAWATGGEMDLRFRTHLTAGTALTAAVSCDNDHLEIAIRDVNGGAAATATAGMAGDHVGSDAPRGSGRAHCDKVAPTHDLLRDRILSPVTFEFKADRDLAFTAGIPDGDLWRSRGWAHPAWLAGGTNSLVKQNIDFGKPGHWINAGISVRHERPVDDGSTVTLSGQITRLFDRRRHRFATASVTAWVDGRSAAFVKNTFVYDTLDGSSSRGGISCGPGRSG